MESEEFRQTIARSGKADVHDHTLFIPLNVPRNDIEVHAAPQDLTLLLQRVEKTWKHLGSAAPFWSVLTDPRYRPEAINKNMAAFYRSGLEDIDIIRSILLRCVPGFDMKSAEAIEYGCGVGRVTAHLGKLCAHVTACDVSEPHLAYAKDYLEKNEIRNVSFAAVTAADLMPANACDLWFSRIVLQHNPPPVIAEIIRQAFLKLKPGGVAVFQVPTYRMDYDFSISKYLKSDPHLEMEMHAIPQIEIFRVANTCGVEVLEVREDNSVGAPQQFVSNTFCFRRPHAL